MKNKGFAIVEFLAGAVLVILVMVTISWWQQEQIPEVIPNGLLNPKTCTVNNCHGLDVTCGFTRELACTFEYQLGDKCRQYAHCEETNGNCQLVKNTQFENCKACVEDCLEKFEDDPDPVKAASCESECT